MVRRGEIYWYDFGPPRSSVEAGRRPALVVQWDVTNRSSRTTMVVPLTSQPRRRAFPFHVPLTAEESGLAVDGTILCEQVQTIPLESLEGFLASLTPGRMDEVDVALHWSLGLKN